MNNKVVKKEFKMTTRCILMTFKECGQTKEEILSRCNKTEGLFGAAVAREEYRNGKGHFHVFLETLSVKTWTMQQLDTIGGVHGDYKPVPTTPKKCLAYVLKNGDYVATESTVFQDYIQAALASYAYNHINDVIKAAFLSPDTKLTPRNFQINVKTGPTNKK